MSQDFYEKSLSLRKNTDPGLPEVEDAKKKAVVLMDQQYCEFSNYK